MFGKILESQKATIYQCCTFTQHRSFHCFKSNAKWLWSVCCKDKPSALKPSVDWYC